jgi:hypothetical protein
MKARKDWTRGRRSAGLLSPLPKVVANDLQHAASALLDAPLMFECATCRIALGLCTLVRETTTTVVRRIPPPRQRIPVLSRAAKAPLTLCRCRPEPRC